ncbi:peptidoglycan binding domain-containing protein [Penicillium oxalicum 114-2]|uniref:Peptidoglycan binding domain-containing protein n=1 Tax=Penicillium oxalicum (strain 114-2 / CGMCC 5302) TaxID=933388 RepID=S7ZLG3_PENO1|nr:peptidoglycan binding domain-containing protein [Penicillium oxalicum 114-2]
MFTLPLILAAGSLPLISGAPVAYTHGHSHFHSRAADAAQVNELASHHSLAGRGSNLYASVFGGNGQVSDGWPAMSHWVSSFDDLFESNKAIMGSSCSQWGVPDTTESEMADMKSAIIKIAGESGVDARFILAIIMQESNGCVRVHTTNNGVVNPGLMQSHNGKGSCNTGINAPENVQNPCPASEIEQMIRDGTMGTADGDGLKQLLAQNGGTDDVTAYYKAARCYNSGSIAANGNLGAGIATHCYASDIANRLLGWAAGTSSCNDNTIGSLTGSNWSGSSSSGSSSTMTTALTNPTGVTTVLPEPAAPTSTSTSSVPAVVPTEVPSAVTSNPAPTADPAVTSTVTIAPAPTAPAATSAPNPIPIVTSSPAATSSSTSTTPTTNPTTSEVPLYPYAITTCQQWYSVVEGDYCLKVEQQFGISASDLQDWNTGLDDACTNLWKGYKYCVKA